MSLAEKFTTALINSTTAEEVKETIKTYAPKFCGYKIAEVSLAGGRLSVVGIQTIDNGYEARTNNTLLLDTDLKTGYDYYGRKAHLGLGPVDIHIIKNIIGQ